VAQAVVVAPGGEATRLAAAAGEPAVVPWAGYAVALVIALALAGYLVWTRVRQAAEGRIDDQDTR
jgi:hypothetical protein